MIKKPILSVALLLGSSILYASEATVTPFVNGAAATANSVNSAFSALVTAINDNNSRIAMLESATFNNDVANRTYSLTQMGAILRADGEVGFATIGNTSQSYTLAMVGITDNSGSFNLSGTQNEGEIVTNGISFSATQFQSPVSFNEDGTWVQSGPTVTLTFADQSITAFQTTLNGSVIISNDFSFAVEDDSGGTTDRSESSLIIGVDVTAPPIEDVL